MVEQRWRLLLRVLDHNVIICLKVIFLCLETTFNLEYVKLDLILLYHS